MADFTPKQLEIRKRLLKAIQDGETGILENLLETEQKFEDALAEIKQKFEEALSEVKGLIPDKTTLTPVKGTDYFDGIPGESYVLTDKDKQDIAQSIKVPVVTKVVEKVNTVTVKEQPIVTNQVKEVAVMDVKMLESELPKYGNLIRDGLELLPRGEDGEEDQRLDKAAIKGIEGIEKELDSLKKRPVGVGGGPLDSWRNGSGLIGGKITVSSTAPSNPAINDIWFVLP